MKKRFAISLLSRMHGLTLWLVLALFLLVSIEAWPTQYDNWVDHRLSIAKSVFDFSGGICPSASKQSDTMNWSVTARHIQQPVVVRLEEIWVACSGVAHWLIIVVCRSVVFEIETQLNNTVDDYEMDVVFRISEEKKKIRRSRSEVSTSTNQASFI